MPSVLIGIIAAIVGWVLGWFVFDLVLSKKKKRVEAEILKAKREARELYNLGESKAQKLIEKAEKEIEHRQKKIDQYEERLAIREQKIEEKLEKLEEKKEEYKEKTQELEVVLQEQQEKLATVAQLSPEEAKRQLFEKIEIEQTEEIARFVNKYKLVKEEEAKGEAAKIIAKVLPRLSQEGLSEHLVTMVDLPTEDMKWKIIGREGRNIATFERVTGVEVTIDDTPLTIKLSCYDPEKRYIGAQTMIKLLKDGRINPVYIEKLYQETVDNTQELFMKKGKETLTLLNMPMMKPEIVELIGRFHVRYSYGQNLLLHSIEVARLSEMLANELGLNAEIAKKAWLLHDIGKIEAGNGEAHTKVGAEILRKHKMHDIIINTAEGHHFDVELKYPEARVATAADAISASRPGARFDTKEIFSERMSNLENLVGTIPGVQKAYIMQAWREIMTFVNPEEVEDSQLESLMQEIGIKIEEQLDYPGAIRIIGIRERKVTHYLR